MVKSNGIERSLGRIEGVLEEINNRTNRHGIKIDKIFRVLNEGEGKISTNRESIESNYEIIKGIHKEVEKNTAFRNKAIGVIGIVGLVAGAIGSGIIKLINFFKGG